MGSYVRVFQFREFSQQLFFALGQFLGYFDVRLYEQVAQLTASGVGHSPSTQSEYVSRLGSLGNVQICSSVQSRDFDGRAQRRLGIPDGQPQDQVVAFTLKQAMRTKAYKAIAVAWRTSIGARFTLASQTDSHSVVDARGNRHVQRNAVLRVSVASASTAGVGNHRA